MDKIRKKVMVFAVNWESGEPLWLALRNNPHPRHGGDKWFVVTGSVEGGETLEVAAKRELQEETGLVTDGLIKLINVHHNYHSKFHPGVEFDEQGYLAVVGSKTIKLNIEHVDYKWLSLVEFIDIILWKGDKSKLKGVLEEDCESARSN